MKKFLGLSLSALMVLGLAACSSTTTTTNEEAGLKSTYTTIYQTDIQSLDYVTTALAVDHEINANLVDGLLENDSYGHFVGAIAESYESNEDATVWTFNIRPGVKWVTSTGEEYAEVTAHDFVTGLQHAADFQSGTAYLLEGVVENFSEYENGEVPFSEVGVKALDDYTLQYTLEAPTPYFYTMTTYAILYPINEQFLTSQGTGCALGDMYQEFTDREACAFGTTSPDSILYNGAFILTANDAKSVQELTKNASYWDAEHVYLETVTRMYDDGSDPYAVINGFEQGIYDSASLSPQWEDFEEYKEKYADYYYTTLPNATVFGTNWNYNRQTYNYTAHETEEDRVNTQNAIRNVNFRLAYMHAFDRVAYLNISSPEDVSVAMLRNMNQFPEIVTTSDGTPYYELVNKHYNEMMGTDISLEDGQDPFLSKEKALEYIELAKADGIQFPVTLDVLVIGDASPVYVNRGNSMKESVERNTDGNIIINVIQAPMDTVQNICYLNQDPALADYDINTFSGWSPDYADPKSFVDIYSTSTGYYMHVLGLALDDENDPVSQAVKEEVGFTEYERLYREADAITDDMDARYDAFAKADAYMVANGLMIPQQMDLRGYQVSNVVSFTQAHSDTGISEYKFKFMQVQDRAVTAEEYEAAKAEWESNR